jgi:hypothetical protein
MEDLRKALVHRGWKVAVEPHDWGYEERKDGLWRLTRGDSELLLTFALSGGLGETIPLEET